MGVGYYHNYFIPFSKASQLKLNFLLCTKTHLPDRPCGFVLYDCEADSLIDSGGVYILLLSDPTTYISIRLQSIIST